MGKTFKAFNNIYFDELDGGLPIYFDNTQYMDAGANRRTVAVATFRFTKVKYIARSYLTLKITSKTNITENYSKYIDLLKLTPEKFHSSTLLVDFLQEAGLIMGTAIGKINDIPSIIDPYSVGEEYLNYLADLVGLKLLGGDDVTLDNKRNQLISVIDWYKRKGTYLSFKTIGYVLGYNLEYWDMYTNDYSTFHRVGWFVGYENENPLNYSSDYYKSPHFGVDLILDKVYGTAPDEYLFDDTMYNILVEGMEQIRPINVVNHYSAVIRANTDNSGDITTSVGNIQAVINGGWAFSQLRFDNSINHDDGEFFDYNESGFVETITKWELGIGNINGSPDNGDTALDSSVLSGTIDTQTVYRDRIEFDITVPLNAVQDGLTELGLFLEDGTTMVAQATFPSIKKTGNIELRIKFTILT